MNDPKTYEGWISVFSCGTDFEADLVRDRLGEVDIPAVVLTQRDHAFNLNVGDMSPVHVMVPPEHEAAAREVVEQAPLTDSELEEAAMAADLYAPDAYDPRTEAALDSGIEDISFEVPEDEDEEAPGEEG
ncbi:MAG TPA: DUF2007 domain-containing protein [Rubricoccaceae bacterium]|nr:DUF2007 domain-containing protein [Rubricoccaceae bacterium]